MIRFRILLDEVTNFNGNLLCAQVSKQSWEFTLFARYGNSTLTIHGDKENRRSKLMVIIEAFKKYLQDEKAFFHFINEHTLAITSYVSICEKETGIKSFAMKSCYHEIVIEKTATEMRVYIQKLLAGLEQILTCSPQMLPKTASTLNHLEKRLQKIDKTFRLRDSNKIEGEKETGVYPLNFEGEIIKINIAAAKKGYKIRVVHR